ncbi:hypothetical protein [Emticicia sp. TH156]|uniref:hypothetical protein n=1 Tax=Emticicia sp. TH156 TaxID=2067454 RepID=UPI000C7689ED|nr:hypothetical protein [Emticicia sp. TH156]PLK43748.1 hypothetical protein C0V77_14655 [Emticicia sp. TH156]
MNFKKNKQNLLFIIAALLLPVIYGIVFVRNFSLPVTGGGDIDEWEFVGYYLSENLTFDVFPQLNLRQNQTLYPFGVTQVFSDWSLESNYWYALFYKWLGHGAWLNYYYVLSLIISFLGSYLLLKKDFGPRKAFFAGFVVTFFNFYALHKYPYHFNHSTIHWTILSIFADFVLIKRIALKEKISLKWVFLKAFVLIATLGMNLGYICGYALSSFMLSFFVAAIVLIYRYLNNDNQVLGYFSDWANELQQNKCFFLGLAVPPLLLLYFYLPLVWQIYQESNLVYYRNTEKTVAMWSHPLRMLFPYFPFFDVTFYPLTDILKDKPEGLGSGSPGWFCLITGITGLWLNRKKYWLTFLPLLILLLIYTFYHPNRVPTVKIFPWGTYNRVPSRFTSILPVIFSCFFLTVNFYQVKYRNWLIGVMCITGLTELVVVYRSLYNKLPYEVDSNFFNYMGIIEKQKGEAVLDFPFCIVGGDGSGMKENLCPLYEKTCNIYALRRFHHKKVMGAYYSYIQPQTIRSFTKINVSAMQTLQQFNPEAKRERLEDLTEEQLAYLVKYFQYNDFCGINLCIDLISEQTYNRIVKTLGMPIAATVLPGAGRAVFIPKPDEWRKLVNREKVLSMRFPCGCY